MKNIKTMFLPVSPFNLPLFFGGDLNGWRFRETTNFPTS
jgi:hypothetical protein